MAYDEETAERVRRILRGRRGITEKKLMGGLSFMADDVMCCAVSGRGGLLVRVIPDKRDQWLGEAHAEPADISGRRMTGFIRVQLQGFRTDASLKKWIERGLAAAADRPKQDAKAATKKSRSAASKQKRA